METETRKIKITGITELLASYPANKELYTSYIASKAAEAKPDETGDMVRDEEGSLTVFPRNSEGIVVELDYQLKGFIKEAINNLKSSNGVAAGRKKVDNYVFIEPRQMPIMQDGAMAEVNKNYLERPLRANTMQGERVSLASSEVIAAPWEIVAEITVLSNNGTKLSQPIDWDKIEEALNYGYFKGLGQWRNGGYGRFKWEYVE